MGDISSLFTYIYTYLLTCRTARTSQSRDHVVTWSRFSTERRMDGSTLTCGTRTAARQLTVEPSVEFSVTVQSQHQPTTVLYDRHAARPESLSTVIWRVRVRVVAAESAAHAVTRLRRARVVDNYVFVVVVVVVIIIILVVVVNAGVVVLPRSRRMLDSAAPAKKRSERVADRECWHSRPPSVEWEGSWSHSRCMSRTDRYRRGPVCTRPRRWTDRPCSRRWTDSAASRWRWPSSRWSRTSPASPTSAGHGRSNADTSWRSVMCDDEDDNDDE